MPSPARSSRRKRLGRRLVLTAQAACDVRDLDTAFQILQAAELLLRAGRMTTRDKLGIVDAIVGVHVRLWELRHDQHTGPAFARTSHRAPDPIFR